jgi:hypothetical protein
MNAFEPGFTACIRKLSDLGWEMDLFIEETAIAVKAAKSRTCFALFGCLYNQKHDPGKHDPFIIKHINSCAADARVPGYAGLTGLEKDAMEKRKAAEWANDTLRGIEVDADGCPRPLKIPVGLTQDEREDYAKRHFDAYLTCKPNSDKAIAGQTAPSGARSGQRATR